MRAPAIVLGAAALLALAACSDLPSPHVVVDPPRLARVAERFAAPPLRPVPDTLVELRPPFECDDCKGPAQRWHFAGKAGVVYFATDDRYAVLDIGTGEVVAAGAAESLGAISDNGRLLLVPVDGALQIRDVATGATLATLPVGRENDYSWTAAGLVYVAPPAHRFADPRVVFFDPATGLESSLFTVPAREKDAPADVFGVVTQREPGRFLLHVDEDYHWIETRPGPDGLVASVADSWPVAWPEDAVGVGTDGQRIATFTDEAIALDDIDTHARAWREIPGFFPTTVRRTPDRDRLLVRASFRGAHGSPLQKDGEYVLRTFLYSISRDTLAPVDVDVHIADLFFVWSVRGFVFVGDDALQPYTLPAAGAEGDPATVLAAAKAEVIAAGVDEP